MQTKNLAIALAILSTLGFAIQDMVVKLLSEIGSLWQLMFLRAILVVLILVTWAVLKKRSDIIKPKDEVADYSGIFNELCIFFFLRIASICRPCSSCFLLLYRSNFTCFFAAVILREKIGFWRISSILIGFLGVLYIIQPGTSNMQAVLFLPVLAGASYALAVVITRGFCADYPSYRLQ